MNIGDIILNILITGGAGLVGSELVKVFSERNWNVKSVDNYMRGTLFGEEGSTKSNMDRLRREYNVEHYEMDICDEKIVEVLKNVDAVIHTAAQPSHPKSVEIPMEDFRINAYGTLFLLENLRKYNSEAIFIYCSTNKVYGEKPNYFAYRKIEKRFEPIDPALFDGFDESLGVDQTMHTPFGVSKTAADLYTQEYSRLYGLKTGVFRMGCITGSAAMAIEQHNWEPYFVRKALNNEKLTIYGYGGYQVRDVIHTKDLANLFSKFIDHPRGGEIYNIGGGRKNSISLLEAIELIEEITGKRMIFEHGKEREGDHIWYITNLRKVKSHYPDWDIRMSLRNTFKEIYESQIKFSNLKN